MEKQAILFIDEFQDILKLEDSTKIQGAIRSVAQHSSYVTYIFSGSSRLMLEKIFDDANQPLYMMCNKILLKRIGQDHFKKHIQKASKSQWGKSLPDKAIENILNLTECHTYYVNVLCNDLIALDDQPTLETVKKRWEFQLSQFKEKLISDLEKLNTNRLKVLVSIALLDKVNAPNSRHFLETVKLPLSSVQTAIKYLLDYDYLYETNEGFMTLVDPLMKLFLQERYQ